MKSLTALIFAFLFAVTAAIRVSAQSAESIWLTANTSAYKTGETVLVSVNGSSANSGPGFHISNPL